MQTALDYVSGGKRRIMTLKIKGKEALKRAVKYKFGLVISTEVMLKAT